jgi:dihydrolipoamide dehydrogenase
MVESVEDADGGVAVNLSNGKTLNVDMVLSSIGRKPNTEGLTIEKSGIETDESGFIKTNEFFETSVEGIYAIGDVIATPMLAHTAEHEGIVAVEKIAGEEVHEIDYRLNPGCIYSIPSIASMGVTEQAAEEMGFDIKVGKFPFSANGKAVASNHTKGFVKVIIDAGDHKILGVHIIGHGATDLIAEFIPVMNMGATAEDIVESIHPHPTLSEASLEATLSALGRTIHM